jgi:diguanylate cyclase (GGDEF)-like protein/PAS domain S-box-containing protein
MSNEASKGTGSDSTHQQAAANLYALIESTEDLIWSIDLDFGILTYNAALKRHVERHFGTQIEVGKRPEDLLPPERAAIWPPLFRRALAEGPFRAEIPFPTDRIVEISFNPIMVDGRTAGISMFGKDITERKRAEELLRESRDSLREAQAIGGLGSYELDMVAGTWTGSEVMDQLFGVDEKYEHTVEGWAGLLHTDDSAMVVAYWEAVAAGQYPLFDKEYRIVRPNDKEVRWVHGQGKLEYNSDGRPIRMRGVIKDITERKQADKDLRNSEERYRSAFQTSIDAININRFIDGRYIDVNDAFLGMIGFTREELLGRTSLELGIWVDPEDRKRMTDAVRLHGACRDIEAPFRKKNGEIFWAVMSASKIDVEGVECVLSISRDITEAKADKLRLGEAAQALKVSEERYRKVFQTSLDPILINRASDRRFIDANQAFLDVMGFECEEVIGKTSLELDLWVNPGDLAVLDEALARNLSFRNVEVQVRKKNGETLWGLMSATVIEIDGVQCVLSVTRDITQAKAAEDEIHNLAFYDPLTGLPNRRLLIERLHGSLAVGGRNARLRALLFVDLDNFKTLNDTLGHQTGDLLLQEAARRLAACVRENDTLGRLGGDEFVVMLEDLSEVPEEAAAQAGAVSEKILSLVSQPYLLNGREYRSSASIGVSVFGHHRESSKEILQQADIAMYQAKGAGRNTTRFFAPALQAAVNARATLEQELRQAIKAEQFVLFYQPQIDRNRLAGAEALIRWNHPRRGLLNPGEFIALAEETELILPIGKSVLEAACRQIAAWAGHKKTAKLAVSVNISARQFRQPHFVQEVLGALESAGANAKNLRLELTETILVENVQDVIDKMKELKAHGLRFSLDDFGTGYSSLAYLKKLPLDQLKIDRSFIRDILSDESSAAIAQTIISLSRAMGLTVIAEGVETEAQREFLTRLGCHAFQGYLFSRPLPLDEFQAQWLSAPGTAESTGEAAAQIPG